MLSLNDRIRRAAAHPQGLETDALLPEFSAAKVGVACFKLAQRGELHRLRHKGRVTFFARVEDRDRAAAKAAPPARRTDLTLKAPWPPGTPAVNEGQAPVQIVPGFRPRFQAVAEIKNIYGGNQRGRTASFSYAGALIGCAGTDSLPQVAEPCMRNDFGGPTHGPVIEAWYGVNATLTPHNIRDN